MQVMQNQLIIVLSHCVKLCQVLKCHPVCMYLKEIRIPENTKSIPEHLPCLSRKHLHKLFGKGLKRRQEDSICDDCNLESQHNGGKNLHLMELTWYSNLQLLEIFDMHNMVLREFS